MSYDGKINRKLKTVELNDDECFYKLAYEDYKKSSFKRKDILKYVNVHYLENDNIIEENLLNDLITFKTYRSQVEEYIAKGEIFQNILNLYFTVISIFISFNFGVLSIKKDLNATLFFKMMKNNTTIFTLVVLLFIFSIFLAFTRTSKKSQSSKLKFIDNAIYTLETIKEDKYRNGNWCTKSDERYEGLELTEVKEIRTYTYKATKNKYSPRAMYERKRR